jgi:hypothetical protein
MNTLLLFLAALSLHRIWNYEDVAAPVRALFPWKPLSCAVCNPFWIAALVAAAGFALGLLAWPAAAVFPFAAYLPIRATVWAYDRIEGVPVSAAAAESKEVKTCSSCAQKQADLAAQREKALSYQERVVILTAMPSLAPWVAMLAGVLAQDHKRMVQVWLSAAAEPRAIEDAKRQQEHLGPNVVVRAVTPFFPDTQIDQIADEKAVAQVSGEIGMQLMTLGNAKVLTVDAIYDPHLLPLAQAVQQFSQTRAFGWVHYVSGIFGFDRPTDPVIAAARATIPVNHRVVTHVNFAQQAMAFYRADAAQVIAAGDVTDIATAIAEAKPIA